MTPMAGPPGHEWSPKPLMVVAYLIAAAAIFGAVCLVVVGIWLFTSFYVIAFS